jgi:RHS repeat-associated protein
MYYYDGLTVIAEKEQIGLVSWSWKRIFTNGPGVIGNIFRISTWNGSSWSDAYYHYDAIGNVVMKSTSSGGPFSTFDQEAYGNVKIGSQSGYHLTTKEYDSSPELYYFWQRWYDPIVGRFISYDIIDSINRYKFCLNNPSNNVDSDGLKSKPITGPEAKKYLDLIRENCPINKILDDAERASCCQKLEDFYQWAWGDVGWLEGFLGSPKTSAHNCATQCSCTNSSSPGIFKGANTGEEIMKAFNNCMIKWGLTYNPWTTPGVPIPGEPKDPK